MECKEMPETLGFTIIHTGKMLIKAINGIFSEYTDEVTFEQMGILYYISRNEKKEMIQQDIAEMMDKTKSAILRSIDILEEKGLVKRVPVAGDRRKNIVAITQKGNEIVNRVFNMFLRYDILIKEGIDMKSLETCIGVLNGIQKKCKPAKNTNCPAENMFT